MRLDTAPFFVLLYSITTEKAELRDARVGRFVDFRFGGARPINLKKGGSTG